ncbi:HAD family hydrolase [Achromobacter aloeverae]|uniref:HAD family hydrolase n=1 Tax=Achromobacter aloeverae TaxID=1750518 RepID=A0A4Q1HJN8_9BURK|nr:HAD family phosphatase [Achromobacter aloeverae]RXN90149.1 HAD family hydrolase [Achromobacter aloeverae]
MPDFPFHAVLFDCDGVLVDSEPITNRILTAMLGEMGWRLTLEETLRIFLGKTVLDEAPRIQAETGHLIDAAWIERFRARRNAALEAELLPVPGAPEAVRAVHAAVDGRIAVASGADRYKLHLQLTKIGLQDCFGEHVVSGQEQARNKPWPDVYLAAARTLDVDPARCAVVEDSVTGARAGVAAGATVFGYSPGGPGHSDAQALLDAGVAQVLRDMRELPSVLAGWRAR